MYPDNQPLAEFLLRITVLGKPLILNGGSLDFVHPVTGALLLPAACLVLVPVPLLAEAIFLPIAGLVLLLPSGAIVLPETSLAFLLLGGVHHVHPLLNFSCVALYWASPLSSMVVVLIPSTHWLETLSSQQLVPYFFCWAVALTLSSPWLEPSSSQELICCCSLACGILICLPGVALLLLKMWIVHYGPLVQYLPV